MTNKIGLYLCLCLCVFQAAHAQAVKVSVSRIDGGWILLRDGKPYYVKGLAGSGNADKALAIGANSMRTWGPENAQEILDDAHRRGLTVMLGLWLTPERGGFDYGDADAVRKQLAALKPVVDAYKNHPALLMWGIGNELNYRYTNPAVWRAVEDVAKYIHRVDPNHPAVTVTAGLHAADVEYIKELAPDIDILGVNSYGEIATVRPNIEKFGWSKPYLVTEWGPNGPWESPMTAWNVAIEPSSSDKRQVYYRRYMQNIAANRDRCLGSYAFLWGAKQEYTETWFGLLDGNGLETEPTDALAFAFTGQYPDKPAPTILRMTIDDRLAHDDIHLIRGKTYRANVLSAIATSMNRTGDDSSHALVYAWKILQESADKKIGGDAESSARKVEGLIARPETAKTDFRAPDRAGPYRLFVTVRYADKIAYANIPFLVE